MDTKQKLRYAWQRVLALQYLLYDRRRAVDCGLIYLKHEMAKFGIAEFGVDGSMAMHQNRIAPMRIVGDIDMRVFENEHLLKGFKEHLEKKHFILDYSRVPTNNIDVAHIPLGVVFRVFMGGVAYQIYAAGSAGRYEGEYKPSDILGKPVNFRTVSALEEDYRQSSEKASDERLRKKYLKRLKMIEKALERQGKHATSAA